MWLYAFFIRIAQKAVIMSLKIVFWLVWRVIVLTLILGGIGLLIAGISWIVVHFRLVTRFNPRRLKIGL